MITVSVDHGTAHLVVGVFITIIAATTGWNVYVSTASRRHRAKALKEHPQAFNIAVSSSSKFTFTTLGLMLDGLRSSTGPPVRIVHHSTAAHYDAVIIDLTHPGDCEGVGSRRIGIYFTRQQPQASVPVVMAFRLPKEQKKLAAELGLTDDSQQTTRPTTAVWILFVVSMLFICALIWSTR